MLFEKEGFRSRNYFIRPFQKSRILKDSLLRGMRKITKDGKLPKKKRISAGFSFCLLDVWGESFESCRRLFILIIGYNFIKMSILDSGRSQLIAETTCQHIFAIIQTCQLKGVGVDLPLHRILLRGM